MVYRGMGGISEFTESLKRRSVKEASNTAVLTLSHASELSAWLGETQVGGSQPRLWFNGIGWDLRF